MRARPTHQAPYRFWAPARFRALVSIVAAAAAGLLPAAVVLLPATPAHAADPGDIIIEYDLEDLEAGIFTFEITRAGPTTDSFVLDYATTTVPGAAHDATPDVDFTAISGSTTFSASNRDAVKRITVYGLADTKDENTEKFGLALTNVDDPLNNLAIATMNDDDPPPTYTFSAAETVAEDIGTVTTTATLNSLSDFPITIPYTTANGTAAAPGDYTTTAGTLSFAPLEDTKTITVPVIDDALDEPAETFTVAASGTPTGATQSVASKTVTITDNDTPPVVSIATAGSVREGDTLNFPVSLDVVSGQDVTVVADTANGTAVAPGDFDALSAQLVTIPAGQLSVSVPVVTKVDANDESGSPEGLQVALSSPVGATLGTTPASGTITDSVATVTPVTSVTEGNSGSHNQVFDVTLSAAPSGTVEVGYTVTAGTATAGTDFDAVDGTLTYAAGDTVEQITVPVRGDTLYEGNETFDINLTSTTVGGVTGGLGPHSITIPEDDAAPTVTSVTSESVAEGSGNHNVTFTATLSNASHEDVTLDVTAVGGTAVDVGAGVGSNDFDILDTSVDVAAGATTATFRVQVNGDAVYETDESTPVTATVTGTETGATAGSNASGTLTVTNDDVVPVISVPNISAAEGTAAQAVSATVSGESQAAIDYTIGVANGTAEPADYDATNMLSSGTITPGATNLALGTIALLDDTVDDAVDAVDVTVTPAGLVAKTGTVTITDAADDTAPKVVGTANVPINEDAGPALVPVSLSFAGGVSAALSTENPVSVNYSTAPNTATAGLDYTAVSGTTLTFAPGETSKNASVTLTDDDYFEIAEDFTVTLSGAVGAATVETDVATVAITDDDGPAPGYSVAPVGSVTEGGVATFRVTMDAPAAVDTDFVVTSADGTVAVDGAAAASDFTDPNSAPVTVLKDATTADFTVQTTQDMVYEGTETATVQVDPDNGVTSVIGSAETATLTITDNDAIPTLTLNTGSPTEGNTFGITGTQTGVAERDMNYTVSVAGDSSNSADPTESGDIAVTGTPVTITGGQTPTDLALDTVTVNGDVIDENAEVFAATVRNTTVGADAGTRSYTVPDAAANMSPELVFGSPVTVAEDTGTAAIPVSKDWSALAGSGNTATSTEVTITAVAQTANGSATAPGDYTETTVSPLTFLPGDSSKNVDVPIHVDAVYELTETFTLGLSQPSGATIPVAGSTVTITDDDQAARPSFSVDAATGTTVTEGGLVTYTVSLSAASVSDTDFDITLTGGDATGADFTTPPTTVQIAAGQTSAQVQVQTADDSLYEGAETRTLGIALASGETDVTGSTQNRTLTLNDNEAVPTIALVTDSDVEGQSVTVAATPDAVAERAMTYTLTIAGDAGNGGNAAENTDFNHALTTVTVPANSAAGAPVTLGTINLDSDAIDEETETIKVTAHNDTYSATDVFGYYTIDDDPADTAPTMNLGSPVTVAEAGTNATVPVTLDFTGSSATTTEKAVSAGYSTTPGTATAGADYTATPGTVTFVAGNNTANISVPISSDTLFETDEAFTVAIASPVNATLGTATNTVTITDDDSAAIPAFTVSDPVTVAEDGGVSAEFTVTLASAAADTIDFDAAIVNGTTTTAGTTNLGKNDYTAPATDFTIAKDATTATVSIPITNDTAYEGTETFDLQVSLDSGETLATGSMAARTVTITDDESVPTLTLAGAEEAENASVAVTATTNGLAEREMSYSLTLAGDATVSGSNAAESADFTDSGVAGTVTAGTASGSTVTLRSVPLLADTVDEPVETIKVTAANTTYNTTPAVSAMYTITDDTADTAPAVTFGAGVPVAEGSGPATVPVTLDYTGSSAATTEWPVSADYATVAGTASAGADYTVSSGTVSFTAGNNSSSFTVPVVSDNLFETDEQFDVTLANPVNATLGTATNTVTINDDDSGAIPGFTVSDPVTVVEGTATNAVFTVTLGSAAAGAIDFDAAIVNGTTTAGGTANLGKDDYTAPAADFTIAKDQTTATVTIPITNDTAYEGAETFDLQISLDSAETLASGPLVARTVTITDDESVPTLTLSGAEAAENASVAVSATVNGLAERDMTYSLTLAGDATVSGSNAAEPADFTNSPSPTTVTGGTASGTTVDLGSIPLLADTVDEPVETIKATAANTTYTSAAPASAFYTITDDVADLPPSVSVVPKTVPESIGNAAVPVTLSFGGGNDATSSEQAVSITSQLVAGTAGAGDYGNPAVQTIAAGATTGTIPVPIVNDTILESDESFQLKVTSVGPAGATIGTDAATVTITDDDVAATKPSFDVGSVSVGEGGGSATFAVTLSEAARADVDLTVAGSDGSATEATGGIGSDDYDKPAGTLRIASGSRTGTFTVPVRQDTVYENDETARFTVALAQGETDAIGSAREATLSITNDDARPALSLSASAGGAEGEITSLTATIDGATQPSLNYGSLAVSTGSTGDPAETSDFKLIGGDVVVPSGTGPGARADVAAFQLLDDTVDEAVESFDVALGTRRATVRINDDPADAAPTVSISDESVRENAESADLQVALNFTGGTTGTERKITVPWRTIAGTAEAGSDFEAASGTATFEPGTGTVTVKVPIVGDTVGEEDEEFVVRLDAPAPNDVKLGKADGTVTVEDDDTIVKPTLNIASAVVTGVQRVRLSGTAAPGAKVELLSAANVTGTGGYKVVLSTEADDDGKFSFNPNFTQGYRLFVRANALVSPVRTVEVRQDPTITAVSRLAGAATITVTGDPDRAGQTVRIQRLTSGEWDTVATGKLTAAGTFATTQRGLRSGRSVTYRGVIAASPALGILAGNSPARTVKVR